MVRRRGYYRGLSGETIPHRCVALATDGRDEGDATPAKHATEILSEWSASIWEFERGHVAKSAQVHGYTVETFWDGLRRFAVKGVTTWIFGFQLSRSIALLQLWKGLEQGTLFSGCHPAKTDDPSRGTGASHRPMVLCLSGTPLILDLLLPPKMSSLRIVGAENYGLIPPSAGLSAPRRAVYTATAVQAMLRGIASRGYGSLKPTAASQAITILRHKHLTHPIYRHNIKPILYLEKCSYHGGRCECFDTGKIDGPVYHLDLTSCYGSLGRDLDLPVSLAEWADYGVEGCATFRPQDRSCIADVLLETGSPDYPVSAFLSGKRRPEPWEYWRSSRPPVREPACIYPIGRYRTCLAGPELTDAWLHRRIVRVYRVAYYLSCPCLRSVMEDFLDGLGKARAAKDLALGPWYKTLIVSLVGKFGETGWRWVDCPEAVPIGPWAEWTVKPADADPYKMRSVAWRCQRQERNDYGSNAVYSIASWITSAARVRLLDLIRTAHRENVYYVDTDCLFVSPAGFANLQTAGELRQGEPGYLTRKPDILNLVLRGIKHYVADGRLTCAGLVPGHTQSVPDTLNIWSYESPAEAIARDHIPTTKRRLVDVHRSAHYLHGWFDGGSKPQPWSLHYEDGHYRDLWCM